MNESYDLANHLLVIAFVVFYWHLLRIWHQPPPSTHDDKATGKKTAAAQAANLAGVALRQLAYSADTVSQSEIPPAAGPEKMLAAIHAADERFDEAAFLAGAAKAYELVVNAYAEGDTGLLERLLDPDAASAFADAISARRDRGDRITLTFIGIHDTEIVHAWTGADLVEITVRFTSDVVAATYAADGSLIDGDPRSVAQMTDRWTFARGLHSRDPNWKIVATEEG